MDRMPWQAVLFYSIPEGMVMMCLGMVLVGIKPRGIRLVIAGVIYAAVSYVIRGLPLPYGIHTLLHVPLVVILIALLMGAGWKNGAIAALVGLFGLGVVENLVTPLVLEVTGITVSQALNDVRLRVLVPLPQVLVMAAIAYICLRHGWWLFKVGEAETHGAEEEE